MDLPLAARSVSIAARTHCIHSVRIARWDAMGPVRQVRWNPPFSFCCLLRREEKKGEGGLLRNLSVPIAAGQPVLASTLPFLPLGRIGRTTFLSYLKGRLGQDRWVSFPSFLSYLKGRLGQERWGGRRSKKKHRVRFM